MRHIPDNIMVDIDVDTVAQVGEYEYVVSTWDNYLINVKVDNIIHQEPDMKADNLDDYYGFTELEITITSIEDGEDGSLVYQVLEQPIGRSYSTSTGINVSDVVLEKVYDAVLDKMLEDNV